MNEFDSQRVADELLPSGDAWTDTAEASDEGEQEVRSTEVRNWWQTADWSCSDQGSGGNSASLDLLPSPSGEGDEVFVIMPWFPGDLGEDLIRIRPYPWLEAEGGGEFVGGTDGGDGGYGIIIIDDIDEGEEGSGGGGVDGGGEEVDDSNGDGVVEGGEGDTDEGDDVIVIDDIVEGEEGSGGDGVDGGGEEVIDDNGDGVVEGGEGDTGDESVWMIDGWIVDHARPVDGDEIVICPVEPEIAGPCPGEPEIQVCVFYPDLILG